ncbi:MAG: glycosyltransferase family 9 protein, partial [Bacteroidaceae bacterium]
RKRGKEMEQLLTSPERYARVLAELGYPTRIAFRSVYGDGCGPIDDILPLTGHKGTNQWVGIAPFAQHRGKVYPTELMEQVVQQVAARDQVQVFLFGGGTEEQQKCEAWAKTYPSVTSLVGKSDLRTELHVMSHLDVMVSMDSANMHLASIVATPVVSIWGATHPYAGFMGWQQSTDNAIQLDLPCRPCSVYGKKPCALGTYACLYGILPTRIVERVVHLLEYKRKKETNL